MGCKSGVTGVCGGCARVARLVAEHCRERPSRERDKGVCWGSMWNIQCARPLRLRAHGDAAWSLGSEDLPTRPRPDTAAVPWPLYIAHSMFVRAQRVSLRQARRCITVGRSDWLVWFGVPHPGRRCRSALAATHETAAPQLRHKCDETSQGAFSKPGHPTSQPAAHPTL
jgi:hypothetical protein